jgi:hypothetical protein
MGMSAASTTVATREFVTEDTKYGHGRSTRDADRENRIPTKSSPTRPRRSRPSDRLRLNGAAQESNRAVGYTTAPVLKTSGLIGYLQGKFCTRTTCAPACAPVFNLWLCVR